MERKGGEKRGEGGEGRHNILTGADETKILRTSLDVKKNIMHFS